MATIHSSISVPCRLPAQEIPSNISTNQMDREPMPTVELLLKRPPLGLGFIHEELQHIADAQYLAEYLQVILKGDYLNYFLSSVEWWNNLGINAARQIQSLGESDDIETILHRKLSRMLLIYHDASDARLLVGSAYGADPTGLELVKLFWEFAQFVMKLLNRAFPETDFGHLVNYV